MLLVRAVSKSKGEILLLIYFCGFYWCKKANLDFTHNIHNYIAFSLKLLFI